MAFFLHLFFYFEILEKYINIKLNKIAVIINIRIYIEKICWYKVTQGNLVIYAAVYAGLEELLIKS